MTLNDLYRRTLERLQVASDGEPAQPGDLRTVQQKYAEVFEMLESRGLADWDSEADIPADAGAALTMVMAAYCAEDFFVPEPRKGNLKLEGMLDIPQPSLAERILRKRVTAAYISAPVQTEYY